MEGQLKGGVVRTGGATFGYASLQASSGVPGPGGVMSCSDVMYQYYPYLYQTHRPPPPHPTHPHAAPHSHPHANPHAAHHSPARPAPFQPFPAATATHQYDRVSREFLFLYCNFSSRWRANCKGNIKLLQFVDKICRLPIRIMAVMK